jgi:uncharacterized metal-binding protein YceD (DUF177 family)
MAGLVADALTMRSPLTIYRAVCRATQGCSMSTKYPETPEFSRPMLLDRLNLGTFEREVNASEAECAALAERLGLVRLDSLRGHLRVERPGGGPAIRVAGSLSADMMQTCVITLEPFEQRVSESFVQRYTLEEVVEEGPEVFSDPDAEEPPELLEGDSLDLGEVVAEQLALALDAHPRAPGATFEGASYGSWTAADEAAMEAARSPFAALEGLKDGPDDS